MTFIAEAIEKHLWKVSIMTIGRHAKPRGSNRKRIVGTVALTGAAGIALPIVTSATASAASVSTWDRIADCESSGRWFLAGGDRDSTGGLQIRDGTWRDFGGSAISPHAYQASKMQQIQIAQRILAAQGARAWSTTFNGSACTGISLRVLPLPGGSTPDPSPPPKPNPSPQPTPTPTPVPSGGRTYTVRSGDWLAKIAQIEYGNWRLWTLIYQANRGNIGPDPNVINIGLVLTIPGSHGRGHHRCNPPTPQPVVTPPPAPNPTPTPTPPPVVTPPPSTGSMSAVELQVLSLVNAERAKVGLSALAADSTLAKVARDHSVWMQQNDNLTHDLPQGPGERLAAAGVHPMAWGENIADGQPSAAEVMKDWMNSPGHRENILDSSFKKLGVGLATGSDGRMWWTQDFTS